eukprot:1772599-Prorocentrum_lima.AAC.1
MARICAERRKSFGSALCGACAPARSLASGLGEHRHGFRAETPAAAAQGGERLAAAPPTCPS